MKLSEEQRSIVDEKLISYRKMRGRFFFFGEKPLAPKFW